MLVLNYTQFIDKLKKNNAKVIVFYDGHEFVKDLQGNVRSHFDKLVCTDTSILLKEVEEFAKIYPAKFTCYAFTTDKAITKNGDLLHIDLAIRDHEKTASPQQLNEAAIIERVTREIVQKAETDLMAQKLEFAEAKLQQLDNAADKIAFLGVAFVEKLLNGSPASMQGTAQEDPKTDLNIEDAIQILREGFGDKTLIIFAEKVKIDPNLVTKLKMFL